MHLLVMDITIDNDSLELVASTIGSTILRRPSWLPKDACHSKRKSRDIYVTHQ
uniref:Leucine-rich repeat protein n=1 Tax=Solanum tuberosum TaxID=4113 RepID=M1BT20_SOLTU